MPRSDAFNAIRLVILVADWVSLPVTGMQIPAKVMQRGSGFLSAGEHLNWHEYRYGHEWVEIMCCSK